MTAAARGFHNDYMFISSANLQQLTTALESRAQVIKSNSTHYAADLRCSAQYDVTLQCRSGDLTCDELVVPFASASGGRSREKPSTVPKLWERVIIHPCALCLCSPTCKRLIIKVWCETCRGCCVAPGNSSVKSATRAFVRSVRIYYATGDDSIFVYSGC